MQLSVDFHKQFTIERKVSPNPNTLYCIKRRDNESLHCYIKLFTMELMRIRMTSDEALLMAAHVGVKRNTYMWKKIVENHVGV